MGVCKISARKRFAADEQDREEDLESDHATTLAPAPARKQNARAETKRKMVARSETEAEDRKVPGKKERKSDVATSTAPEGDGQDVQLFVSIRAAEVKKNRARCVPPILYISEVLAQFLVGFGALLKDVGLQAQVRPRGRRERVLIQRGNKLGQRRSGRGVQVSAGPPYWIDFDPSAVRRAREYHLRLRVLGPYTPSTSRHSI